MDAGFVGEGVGTDDRLVGLHHHSGEIGDQTRRLGDLLGSHGSERCGAVLLTTKEGVEVATAHMQGHHQFLEGGVAGPLTDAIDGALQLAGSVLHRFQEVGHGQTEIVVTMNGKDRLADVRHMAVDPRDQGTEFRGGGVADRVGDVDGAGPRCDGRLNHLIQKFRIAATGVLTGELDVIHEGAGVGHHVGHDGQHLTAALAQFVLEMDVAGGNEGVDAPPWRRRHGISTGLDVRFGRTGQSTDHWTVLTANLLGNALNSGEISGAGKGEPRFDDVDSKTGQLLGNRQLLLKIETGPRGLLTIPEGGVEDQDATGIFGHDNGLPGFLVGVTMS